MKKICQTTREWSWCLCKWDNTSPHRVCLIWCHQFCKMSLPRWGWLIMTLLSSPLCLCSYLNLTNYHLVGVSFAYRLSAHLTTSTKYADIWVKYGWFFGNAHSCTMDSALNLQQQTRHLRFVIQDLSNFTMAQKALYHRWNLKCDS